jgi:hypothetical protein
MLKEMLSFGPDISQQLPIRANNALKLKDTAIQAYLRHFPHVRHEQAPMYATACGPSTQVHGERS